MIVPTIGRVVWYTPHYFGTAPANGQPFPAFICYVHSDERINVAGFDNDGNPFRDKEVLLVQDPVGSVVPEREGWATWMPFQREQASKSGSGVPASFDSKER